MPPVVAEVFLERDELRLRRCEDCGYKLPMKLF
jgi:DNA-directed RNA polymerase subunit RPC12/RpoP